MPRASSMKDRGIKGWVEMTSFFEVLLDQKRPGVAAQCNIYKTTTKMDSPVDNTETPYMIYINEFQSCMRWELSANPAFITINPSTFLFFSWTSWLVGQNKRFVSSLLTSHYIIWMQNFSLQAITSCCHLELEEHANLPSAVLTQNP